MDWVREWVSEWLHGEYMGQHEWVGERMNECARESASEQQVLEHVIEHMGNWWKGLNDKVDSISGWLFMFCLRIEPKQVAVFWPQWYSLVGLSKPLFFSCWKADIESAG